MKLYSADGSPNALRSRAVLFELDIPAEVVSLDMRKGEHKTPEYLRLNPNGKVPTLVDGDLAIWESRAINAYLAALRPEHNLNPTDPAKRAIIEQWNYWQAIHLGPAMQAVNFQRVLKRAFGMGESDEAAVAPQLKTVAELLPLLDTALAGKTWIADELSLADFALATTFHMRKAAGLGVEAYPSVTAWIERFETRPSWQKALAPIRASFEARGETLG
jgi:glutathione S-transferase